VLARLQRALREQNVVARSHRDDEIRCERLLERRRDVRMQLDRRL